MGAFLLAVLLLAAAAAAATVDDAARDLARRVLAVLGPRDSMALSTSNAAALEGRLNRLFADRRKQPFTVSLTVTISRNAHGPLLVGELVRDEESTVFLAPYDAEPSAAGGPRNALTLEARMLWEQPQPMLDVLLAGSRMVVLEAFRIVVYTRDDAAWNVRHAFPLPPVESMPRDVRGRLVLEGDTVRAYLPGRLCRIPVNGDSAPQCDDRSGDWPLGSNASIALPASLAEGRNYFAAQSLPAFYTAARWGERWAVAATNGQTQLHEASGQQVAVVGDWGADIAAVEAPCSAERYLIGLRGGLQAFTIDSENRAVNVGGPIALGGRLAALWPSGQPGSVTAIVDSPDAGSYAAYSVSLACGR